MNTRITAVLREEFRRSSWIIFIVFGSLFLTSASLAAELREAFMSYIGGTWYYHYINTICYYLPVPVLLALSKYRTHKEDFWGSLPYKARTLQIIRLSYGVLFIALTGLLQMAASWAIMSRYSFFIEDVSYLGRSLKGVYNYPIFLLVCVGAYIIADTVYMLMKNRWMANCMLFFMVLIPELFVTPLGWLGLESVLDRLEDLAELKYVIVFGLNTGAAKKEVLTIGLPIYALIIISVLGLNLYLCRRKSYGSGAKLSKPVKVIYLILFLLFALNLLETFFLQGGL